MSENIDIIITDQVASTISEKISAIAAASDVAFTNVEKLKGMLGSMGMLNLTDVIKATGEAAKAQAEVSKASVIASKALADEETAASKVAIALDKTTISSMAVSAGQEKLAASINKTADSVISNQISYERLTSAHASAQNSANSLQDSMGMLGSATAVLGGKQDAAKTSVEAFTTAQRSSLTAMYGATDAMRSMSAEEAKAAIQGERVAQSHIQTAIQTEKLAQAQNKTKLSAAELTMAEEKLATQMARTQLTQNNASVAFEKANLIQTQNAAAALKSADAHDKAASALENTKNKHNENTSAIEKHTGGWISHIATVAGGIIVYQGIREAMRLAIGVVAGGVKAVSDYEDAIIGMSAMWTTLAKDQSNVSDTYQSNVAYAKELIPVLQQIDQYSGMNLDQLIQMTTAFATQGVVLNKNNQEQIQGYTNISNALLFLTKGQSTSRQIAQEIKAVMQGELKESDALAKVLASQIGPEYKAQIASWIKIGQASGDTGYIIAQIGKHLSGYTAATKDMQNTWGVLLSSLQTTWTLLERDIFTPILKDWKDGLKDVNDYLKEHSKEISGNVQDAWQTFKGVIQSVGEHFEVVKLALSGILALEIVIEIGKIGSALAKTGAILEEMFAAGGLAAAIGAPEVVAIVAVLGLAIYKLANNWDSVKASFNDFVSNVKSSDITTHLTSTFESVKTIVGKTSDGVRTLYEKIMELDSTKSVISGIGVAFHGIADIVKAEWIWLIEKVDYVMKILAVRASEFATAMGKSNTVIQAAKDKATNAANNYSNDAENDYANSNSTSILKLPNLKMFVGDKGKVTESVENFQAYNSMVAEINKVQEEENKINDKTITLAQSNIKVAESQKEYKSALEATDVLYYKYKNSQVEDLDQKNKLTAATDRLKAADKARKDEYSDYEKIIKAVTKADESSIIALDKAYKSTGMLKESAMPLADAYRLQTQAINNLLIAKNNNENADLKSLATASAVTEAEKELARVQTEVVVPALAKAKDDWKDYKDAINSWSSSFSSTLNDALYGGKITFASIGTSFESMITKMIIETKIIKPFLKSIGLGSDLASNTMGMTSDQIASTAWADSSTIAMTSNAKGNAFLGGSVVPFATGGIVTRPTFFPMSNGGTGLMGEDGAEAVMPLTRTSNGKLGVQATGSNASTQPNIVINITNTTGSEIKQSSTNTTFDGKDYIVSTVLESVSTNRNGAKDGLKSMLNIK